MWKLVDQIPKLDCVQVGWTTGSGRPSLQPTDVLLYVIPDIDLSVIEANGGSAQRARTNSKVLGLTQVDAKNNRSLSELYFSRGMPSQTPRKGGWQSELAGAAFHEIAHNKALLDDAMHNEKDGLLVKAPHYSSTPSPANFEFMAGIILQPVQQIVVSQGILRNARYGGNVTKGTPTNIH